MTDTPVKVQLARYTARVSQLCVSNVNNERTAGARAAKDVVVLRRARDGAGDLVERQPGDGNASGGRASRAAVLVVLQSERRSSSSRLWVMERRVAYLLNDNTVLGDSRQGDARVLNVGD